MWWSQKTQSLALIRFVRKNVHKVIIVSSPCAILFISSTVARPSPRGSWPWIRWWLSFAKDLMWLSHVQVHCLTRNVRSSVKISNSIIEKRLSQCKESEKPDVSSIPAVNAVFCCMKQLGVLLLPLDVDHRRLPSAFCHRYPLILLGGERHCESKVSCPRTQQWSRPALEPGPLIR